MLAFTFPRAQSRPRPPCAPPHRGSMLSSRARPNAQTFPARQRRRRRPVLVPRRQRPERLGRLSRRPRRLPPARLHVRLPSRFSLPLPWHRHAHARVPHDLATPSPNAAHMTSPILPLCLTFCEGFERQASRHVSTNVAIDNSPHGPIEIHLSVGATRWGDSGGWPAPVLSSCIARIPTAWSTRSASAPRKRGSAGAPRARAIPCPPPTSRGFA